ncbi:hypothetical protein niasHT_037505 [Heterodera trifolii]|uniref:Phosphoribosyltransferase domain-containing protein n=1 Tax=Heterodera trifolii TaxID=157864 RepID=A0ABD2ILW0_9BILA
MLSDHTDNSNLCYKWTRAGMEQLTGLRYVCAGCRKLLDAKHVPKETTLPTRKAIGDQWVDDGLTHAHFCQPVERAKVQGEQERRKVQNELAMGSRENVASAKVRIDVRVVQNYMNISEEERNKICNEACGNAKATKKALYRAQTKRFMNVRTLQGLAQNDCRALWITLRARSAAPESPFYDELLMRYLDDDLDIIRVTATNHINYSVEVNHAEEESAVSIQEGRQPPSQPLAVTAEIDASIAREKADIMAFLDSDYEDEQFTETLSRYYGRIGHLIGINVPPRLEIEEQIEEAAAMEKAEASLNESGIYFYHCSPIPILFQRQHTASSPAASVRRQRQQQTMSDKKKEEEKKEEPKKEEKSGKDKEEKRRSKKSGKSSKKKDKKKGCSKSRKKEGIKEHHAAAAEQPSAETKTGQTTTDALNDTAVLAYLGEPAIDRQDAQDQMRSMTPHASAETTGQTTTDALNDTAVLAYLGEPAIDRQDAGQKLYKALVQLDLQQQRDKIVILALPRGGVPIAFEIAKAIRVPLDLLLVCKIGAPDNDDSAIGAIAEGLARPILDNETVAAVLLPTSTTAEQFIQQETERQMKEIERQKKTYFGEHRTPIPLDGRVAIVVDDGIATGATARAALAVLRHKNVSRIILAVPVGPPETIDQFRAEGIEVICVATPPTFNAVGMDARRKPTTDALNDTAVLAYLGETAADVGAAEPKEQPSAETKTGQTTTDALNDTAVLAYLGETAAAVGAAEPKEQPSAETKTGQTTTDALNDTAVLAYLGETAAAVGAAEPKEEQPETDKPAADE